MPHMELCRLSEEGRTALTIVDAAYQLNEVGGGQSGPVLQAGQGMTTVEVLVDGLDGFHLSSIIKCTQ